MGQDIRTLHLQFMCRISEVRETQSTFNLKGGEVMYTTFNLPLKQ